MAVAFDQKFDSNGQPNASFQLTVSGVTTSGANRIGLMFTNTDRGSVTTNSATWGGTAMTKVSSVAFQANNDEQSGWYILAPATGSSSVVVTYSTSSVVCGVSVVSFNGVKQTAPEASGGAIGTSTTPSVTITTVADNAMPVGGFGVNNNPTFTQGTGYTKSSGASSGNGAYGSEYGSSLATPTGALAVSGSWSASNDWGVIGLSLAPAASTATRYLPMLGIGS